MKWLIFVCPQRRQTWSKKAIKSDRKMGSARLIYSIVDGQRSSSKALLFYSIFFFCSFNLVAVLNIVCIIVFFRALRLCKIVQWWRCVRDRAACTHKTMNRGIEKKGDRAGFYDHLSAIVCIRVLFGLLLKCNRPDIEATIWEFSNKSSMAFCFVFA